MVQNQKTSTERSDIIKMNDNRFAKLAKNGKSNTDFLDGLQNVDIKAGHQQEEKHTGQNTGHGSIKR